MSLTRVVSVRTGVLLTTLFAVFAVLMLSASAQAATPKVLVYSGGATNESVSAATSALGTLGTNRGFEVTASSSADDFTTANLNQYRAVVLLHSTGAPFSAAQQSALVGFVNGGGGLLSVGEAIGMHPGVTAFNNIFGVSSGDRFAAIADTPAFVVEAGDRVHPATRDLPVTFNRTGRWYTYTSNVTGTSHVVARARTGADTRLTDDGVRSGTTSVPLAWCRDMQNGRTFYTGLGGSTADWSNSNILEHVGGAIEWVSGMSRGGCKATINSNYSTVRLTNRGTGLQFGGESHGVSIAPNGWAIYIGRADCVTNEERGAVAGTEPTARIADFANPNVGVGCGSVHVWDPAAYTGGVNTGVTRAGTLAVYGDRGGGNEVNGKIETGLLGVAVAPDFTQTGHIYLYYYPTFNPATMPPGLADGAQRRITKMAKGRISRFTLNLETKQLDLASEVKILEWESQIFSCCHRGGGMGFDSAGNLYVTTGDNNSSSGGYSGNHQNVRCATGSPTEAVGTHCGTNNISYRDARRTSGSSNDLNGKMLRIKPNPAATSSTPMGIGTTYSIPGHGDPNGPNLFSGTEGNGNQARPEIYAMGLRNPSRLAIDPKTDIPYSAWVGPDATAFSQTEGPAKYETANRMESAGNYGWPYCMGGSLDGRPKPQAYRDKMPNGSARTTNAPGYVSGPNGTQGWYDCDNIANDSANNTGLSGLLPHNTGTGKDAGRVRAANLWYAPGGGGGGCADFPRTPSGVPTYADPFSLCPYTTGGSQAIMAGPVYRYNAQASDQTRRWPKYWDGRWFLGDYSGSNNVRHALLIEDGQAGSETPPAYADSMKSIITWSGGAWMDSKFGPDGAFYLHVYDGGFSAGGNVGLHRISYNGGPDTPNISPGWNAGAQPRQIVFNPGRSGGVEYAWDFDNNGTVDSTAERPVHQYPTIGQKTAKLTVTYADGEELSATLAVTVTSDGGTCVNDKSDSFNGGSLDPKWTGQNSGSRTVEGGNLMLQTIQGDINGGAYSANIIEQDVPTGAWTVTAKMNPSVIDNNGVASGIVVWSSGTTSATPKNWVKFSVQYKTTDFGGAPLNGYWMERSLTTNGALNSSYGSPDYGPNNQHPNSGKIEGGNQLWVRVVHDGATLTPFYSTDGTAFIQSAPPFPASVWPVGPLKFGLFAKHDGGSTQRTIPYDSFTVTGAATGCPDDDVEAPVTSHVVNPPTPIGQDGWNTSPPVVTLTRTDNQSAPEEIQTEWRLGTSGPWTSYTGPIIVSAEGANVVLQYRSTDAASNVEEPRQLVLKNDFTAPVTTAAMVPGSPNGPGGTWLPGAQVSLSATDAVSGVGKREYRIGTSGPFSEYSGPIVFNQVGAHVVQYRSVDVAGHVETAKQIEFGVQLDPSAEPDVVAPNSSASLSSSLPIGPDGWYRAPVSVRLTAIDPGTNASGVDVIEFRQGVAGGFGPYSGPVVVGEDGEHVVSYRARDISGNVESPEKQVSFRIDATPPVTTVTTSSTNGVVGGVNAGPVRLKFSSSDAGSGVANTAYRVDGGVFVYADHPVVVSGNGQHTVEFYSRDKAGNQELAASETFTINTALAPKLRISLPGKFNSGVGRTAAYKVKVANKGRSAAKGVKVCLKGASTRVSVKPKCKTVKNIGAGKTKTVKFKVTVKQAGSVKLTVDARGINAPRDKASGLATGKR